MSRYPLTKTRFLDGLQCPKKLWYMLNRKERAAPDSMAQTRIYEFGHEIGRRAQYLYPGGRPIDVWPMERAEQQTRRAIAEGVPAIFEATFLHGPCGVKVDVLDLSNGAVRLVEVKASARVKDVHVDDVAFQKLVLERTGMAVDGTYLMHVNNKSVGPDADDLLVAQDIGDRVNAATDRIAEDVERLQAVALSADEPVVDIGSHCTEPYKCPFKTHCWADVPANSVFTMPGWKKKADPHWAGGVRLASDLDDRTRLNAAQAQYVACCRSGEPTIDAEGIRQSLQALEHPIHYLDFETDGVPVPRFDDVGPYEKFVFQYSCHVEHADGRIVHREYLHEGLSDPRPALARRLVEDVGEAGSVVAYNASFERGVLKSLAKDVPELAEALLSMAERLWDPRPVVKANVQHPGFQGSYSIKDVLPVLAPGLTYAGRVVKDGLDAQAAWDQAIRLPVGAERAEILAEVRAYCELDTRAMVEIVKALKVMSA